jgi:hypothetical protein
MKIRFITLIFTIFSINAIANQGYLINVGGNLSSFQDNDGAARWSILFGAEKEWQLYRKISFYSGLTLIKKKSCLTDKIVKHYTSDSDVFIYTLNTNVLYLNIPIGLQYQIPINRNTFILINIARSLNIAYGDLSSTKITDQYLSSGTVNDLSFTERNSFIFDNSGTSWNCGARIGFKKILLGFTFIKDLNALKFIKGININKKYQSIAIIVGYHI